MDLNIKEHLDKDNLHHAYLIEGEREETTSRVLDILNDFDIKTLGNPDFYHLSFNSFKIKDALALKNFSTEKSSVDGKKIFLISANSFLLEAQNTLLKIFEEPNPDTHFFIIVSDINSLLPTLVSRFYVIKYKNALEAEIKEAEKFITLPLQGRIDYLKELLVEKKEKDVSEENEEGNDDEINNDSLSLDSAKSKALKFLNALEVVLNKKEAKNSLQTCFEQIFKVRKYLRQSGSSAKNLMESVALITPIFK